MSGPQPSSKPVSLFYSYSHKDESLRDELQTHLTLLKRQKVIGADTTAGFSHPARSGKGRSTRTWKPPTSSSCWSAQLHRLRLLLRERDGPGDECADESRSARVIPIILKPCDWHSAPFGKLQALPKDGKPVTSWSDKDEAFLDIAKGIRAVAEALAKTSSTSTLHVSAPGTSAPTPPTSPGRDRATLVRSSPD